MEQWFIELVIGVYEWLYEPMVYGITYDVYEWFMFMNGCISQRSRNGYLCLWMVVLMDTTWWRKTNSKGNFGNFSRCAVCQSIYCLAKKCPDKRREEDDKIEATLFSKETYN